MGFEATWARLRSLAGGPRRWLSVALAALGVYALLGFFLVPWIAKAQLEKQSRALLFREATVERVAFNPFTLAATIEGLELRDRDGEELLSIARLRANLEIAGLFRRAWTFKELTVGEPRVAVRILADGKPSIADLFEDKASESPGEEFRLPRVVIEQLDIAAGRARFTDASRAPVYDAAFGPLDLDVHALSTLPDREGDHVVTVGFEDGGVLRWSGRQVVDPMRLSGRIEIERLGLVRIWEYLGNDLPLDLRAGQADITFDYELRRGASGEITFAMSGGAIDATGLAVRPRGGPEDWVTVPQAKVDGLRIAWPAATVDVERVSIVEPRVLTFLQPDGRTNWETLLAGFEHDDAPVTEPGAGAEPPWQAQLERIEIAGAELRLEDRRRDPAFAVALTEMELRVEHATTDPRTPVQLQGAAQVSTGGALSFEGTLTLDPAATEAQVALEGFDLVPFSSYLGLEPLALKSLVAGLEGRVSSAGSVAALRFEGVASADRLEILEPGGEQLLAWDRMLADGIDLSLAPMRLRVREVGFDGLFAKVRIDREGQLNLSAIGEGRPTLREPAQEEPPIPAEIGTIAIRSAAVDFADESLILPFRTRIHSAGGSIKDLSTVSAAASTLTFEGRVDELGYVRAGGTLLPADPFASTDVRVTFREIPMNSLTPYAGEFAGYSIERGALDLNLHYLIVNRQLKGQHEIVATDLVLGPKVPGSTGAGLPIRLAIALLKDKEGRIDLDVPVEGTVDSPEFAYRKVVWQAFRKILANVALAPFRALGRLVGAGDDEDLELVDFEPGRSELIPTELDRLTKLGQELAGRSELTVAIEGSFDPVTDAAELRRVRLELLIAEYREAAAAAVVGSEASTLEAILEALYVDEFAAEALEAARQRFTTQPREVPAPVVAEAPPARKTKSKKKGTKEPPPPATAVPGVFDAAGFYAALRAELLEARVVYDEDLRALGRARAEAIAAALAGPGTLDAGRVRLLDVVAVKRKKAGSERPASEMTLAARGPDGTLEED